jgi:transcriptional regulator with XRE-family HTH domain
MGSGKLNNIVGSRVRQARQRRKPPLTQLRLCRQLAKCGAPIDRASISKIEIGMRFVLDYEVVALAKVLGVSVGWLLGEKGKS